MKKAIKKIKTQKKINNLTALFVSLIMFFSLFGPLLNAKASDTVSISTKEDFISFAQKCKSDDWSEGKTFEILNDIDFEDEIFSPIPVFSGVFHGNGHTISGVKISGKGSNIGVFRYVKSGALINGLCVNGSVTPSGSKKNIGGIVGENSGKVSNCKFIGDVSGESSVGGICGYITQTGVAEGCSFEGTLSAKSYTGGITGQNFGTVISCENRGNINITETDEKKSLQDINTEIDIKEIRSTENVDTKTDTGGICGYSKGTIKDCKNYGTVGYKSVGYNTGGICGRTAGYITGCENYGEIYGRKDIGGIAGQAEPYVLLQYSEDVLDELNNVLNSITQITNRSFLQENLDIYGSFLNINSAVDGISDNMRNLSDDISNYASDMQNSVNDAADRLSNTLKDTSNSLGGITNGIKKMSDGIGEFENAAGSFQAAANNIDEVREIVKGSEDDLRDAMNSFSNAAGDLTGAMGKINDEMDILDKNARRLSDAVDELKNALKGKKNAEEALSKTWESLKSVADSLRNAAGSAEEVSKILKKLHEEGYLKDTAKNLSEAFAALGKSFRDSAEAVGDIADAVEILVENIDIHSLRSATKLMERALINLHSASLSLRDAADKISDASDPVDAATDNLKKAIDSIKKGCEGLKNGASDFADTSEKLTNIFKDFANSNELNLPDVPDSLSGNMDGMQDGVRKIQNEMLSLSKKVQDKGNSLLDDIRDINDRLSTLSEIMDDAYSDSLNENLKDKFEDISDAVNDRETRGRIDRCKNSGTVSGDVNSGGIAGSMAIEYDFDPEDDAVDEGNKSFKFTYKTKCVIKHCTNEGKVEGKKNYSGGIAGRMSIGSLMLCDNLGDISASDGSYVGGIAGKSETVIRNSSSKCSLSGTDYIGGIAGEGEKIYNCAALVSVPEYGECAGSIAGSGDKDKILSNIFVSDTLGGIDDVSYKGSAENTDVDSFVRFVRNNFGKDVTFKLRFIADDKVVDEVYFNYGDAIPEESIPRVPEKNGYYGKWGFYNFDEAKFDADIEAEYHRDMDIISSDEKRDNGKSIALLCGAFDDNSEISVKSCDKTESRMIDANEITISGCYEEKYTVRYLPLSEKKVDLYADTGSGLHKLKTFSKGSYTEFEISEPCFKLYEVKKNYLPVIACITGGALVLFVGVFIFIKKIKIAKNKK